MEDFNIVPSTGTFGNAMGVVNQNFELAKEQIDKVSKMKENSLGLFASRENLVSAYPSPQKGQFAYVGNSEPFAIYKCVTDGEWPSTSSGTWDGGTIDLNDFATKDTTDTLFANIKYFSVPQSAFNNGVITLTIEGYKLFVGGSIKLKMGFVLSSGVGVKMNINNTGEKNLYYNGSNTSPLNSWKQNEIIEVFYDGEKFMAYKLFDRKILDSISDSLSESSDVSTVGAVIDFVNSKLAEGYVYAGIATPSTTPVSGKVFYLALTAGTYTNFGAIVVPQGINILKYNGSVWSLDSFLGLDDSPTQGSNNLVKSGGVLDSIIKDGSAFDLSAYNNGATYADLSAALTALNALPADFKKGGMSIKFVQSSDNKYVQYRYTGTEVTGSPNPFLDTDNWQSENLDDIPTDGSNNPVKSGGVAAKIGIGNGKFPNDVISTAELESYIFAFLTDNQKIWDALDNDGKRHIFTDLIIRELYQVGKMSNPEMFLAEIDSEKKIHHYVDLKGLHHFLAGLEIDRLYGIYKNPNPEVFLAEIDKNNNMHHYVDYQGIHYFPAGIVTPTLSNYKKIGEIKIQMPKVINIVQGQNISLYTESVLQNVWAKDYNTNKTNVEEINLVQHSKTPSSHDQAIIIYDEFEKKLAEQNIHINILPTSISGNLKVCMLGDSKTENTTSMCEVLNLCEKNGNLSVQFIGTKQAYVEGKDSDGNSRNPKHEATSGSSIESLCKTNISAFYDSTMSGDIKFNLTKGFTEIGDVPDILWLNYGANQGVYSSVSVYYDYIINAVKAYNTANNTNIKVVISIQEQFATRSRLPYAFNSPYNMGIIKRSFDVSLQDYINAFENRENEGIYICPQYINVDLYNDFPLFKAKVSPRCNFMKDFCADTVHMGVNSGNYNASTTYTYGDIIASGWEDRESLYCCVGASVQGIAPNDDKINWSKCDNVNAGYYKIADVMFATLMYIRNIINN